MFFGFGEILSAQENVNNYSMVGPQIQNTQHVFGNESFKVLAGSNNIEIIIQSKHQQVIDVKVVSLVGKELVTKRLMLQVGENQLNLPFANSLNEGLYFVLIAVDNEVYTKKFMVAR